MEKITTMEELSSKIDEVTLISTLLTDYALDTDLDDKERNSIITEGVCAINDKLKVINVSAELIARGITKGNKQD